MSSGSVKFDWKWSGLLVILMLFSCKNPLVSVIVDEVEEAVTPPVVTSVFPEADAGDVPITLSTISVTFSKSLDPSTVTGSSFFVSGYGSSKLSGIPQVENDTIIFTPSADLEVGTEYTVTVDGVMDTDGNPVSEKYTWSFITGIDGDPVAPVINSVVLNGNELWSTSSLVTVEIDAEDNFGVAQMNISFDNSFLEAGWTSYESSFELDLPAGEGEKAVYIKVKDGSGNISSASANASIMVDLYSPEINQFRINYGTAATNTDSVNLDVSSVDTDDGSGPHQFRYRASGGDWSAWIDMTDGFGSIADIPLSVSVGSSQSFEGQVVDVAGNVSSVSPAEILYETTPPAVIGYFPLPNSTDYPSNAGIVYVTFSEDMNPSSLTTGSFYLTQGSTEIIGTAIEYILEDENEFFPDNTAVLRGVSLNQNEGYVVNVTADVEDVAGNAMTSAEDWFFRTSDAVDSEPPEGEISLVIDNSNTFEPNASKTPSITLDISASDTYNSAYGMKIWGDNNDAGLPAFEEDASWETYSTSKPWTLSSSDGYKYLFYKFMDSASNESETPERLKISMDTTAPEVSGIDILDETGIVSYGDQPDEIIKFTNAPEQTVTIGIDALDETSGIEELYITVNGNPVDLDELGSDSEIYWDPWSPQQTITLPEGDGEITITARVKDFVTNLSTTSDPGETDTAVVLLDQTPPEVSFNASVSLNINEASEQNGTFTDNYDGDHGDNPLFAAGSPLYSVLGEDWNNIASYEWEVEEAPEGGSVVFEPDSYQKNPVVSADIEGEYTLRVTVSDTAGNQSFGTVPMVWDVTSPGLPGSITIKDSAGNPVAYYTNSAQPTSFWGAAEGADFYRIYLLDPNDPAPDWDADPLAVGYSDVLEPSLTAPAPGETGGNDGPVMLRITAWDLAGNHSNEVSSEFFIDTLEPVITADGQSFLTNIPRSINYSGAGGSEGMIYDPRTADDPDWVESTEGSGLDTASYIWAEAEPATGNLVITNTDTLTPTIQATADGEYDLTLSVSDNAGNITQALYSFIWDTTGPEDSVIFAPAATPDSTPTWSWESGGNGGIGEYRYIFIDRYGDTTTIQDSAVSYTPSDQGAGQYELQLSVQELDAAGNWSDSVSHIIDVDTTNITTPFITAPTLTNNPRPTWSWSSGAGADPDAEYRYQLDGGSWIPSSSPWSSDTNYQPSSDLSHGEHTLIVDEYYNSVWRQSSAVVDVDLVGPTVTPTVTSGYTNPETTNDTTPTFTWQHGGSDGISIFRYRYSTNGGSTYSDWSGETTGTSYTYPAALADNTVITLQVQERDLAGNWSVSGSHSITVDTTLPVVSTLYINSGNPLYTNNRAVTLYVTTSGEPVDIQFRNYEDPWPASWDTIDSSTSHSESWSIYGSGYEEAYKYIYCRVRDAAGNVSSYKYDSIRFDNKAPVINSFYINSNATSTSSSSVTLNSSVSDGFSVSSMYVRNGTSGGYTYYSYSTARSWSLSSGYGVKRVEVYYYDAAGNHTYATVTNDMIFYGTPTILSTTKGQTTNGDIDIEFTSYGSEYGAITYNIYTSTVLNGTKTKYNSSPISSTTYSMSLTPGQLYYIYAVPVNSSLGESNYFSSTMIAYSAYIAVIYNDNNNGVFDTTDELLAQKIKTLLEDETFQSDYSTWVSGSMPSHWTVALVPDSQISSSFTTTDDRYIIYGDPVIITPGATVYSSSNRTRNIAHRSANTDSALPTTTSSKSGIVAMGYGGVKFLDTCESYWSSWGYSTTDLTSTNQYPNQIGYGESYSNEALQDETVYAYQWIATESYYLYNPITRQFTTYYYSVWDYPLSSTVFAGGNDPTHNSTTQLSYATLGTYDTYQQRRFSVYRSGNADPDNGKNYARDYNSSYPYGFPVVRQGRFLQFGFPTLTDRPYTGKPYFINLVHHMSRY
ncbi:MAG: Ig-like domain-containing protein [Spirochaetales bacterium]|uniref:Ig-like domain-containing protein n=1 Tax=Candidatus Thalassospirochaeta sargassi TaxID=3119039 RepID=A0AAJ1IG83_9SPIO|nr:Ig-like domain-containing protein [Spirochaetales bacterium]